MKENGEKNWKGLLADLTKLCAALTVIGGSAYFVFGIRFVTKAEFEKHLDWSRQKSSNVDLIEAKLLQTNEGILTNLIKLNEGMEQLNSRMVRVETKVEMR